MLPELLLVGLDVVGVGTVVGDQFLGQFLALIEALVSRLNTVLEVKELALQYLWCMIMILIICIPKKDITNHDNK